jgi:hypothetical protein
MELRGVPGQTDARGGLVAAHRPGLGHDVEVQRAAGGLGERADTADLRDEVVVHPEAHFL